MSLRIVEESHFSPAKYGTVSPAFLVEQRFLIHPIEKGLGGLSLVLENVEPPYVKDYDLDTNEGPANWPQRWDISLWGVISAYDGETPIGGAMIAWNTPQVDMLNGRKDLAVLWDIRVHTEYRRTGLGSSLFSRAMEWARSRGCQQMKIETQDVNVPACSFYATQGCRLVAINPFAYPDLSRETQLLWLIDL
jgi:GNAT superfamily N-acetyltransferase